MDRNDANEKLSDALRRAIAGDRDAFHEAWSAQQVWLPAKAAERVRDSGWVGLSAGDLLHEVFLRAAPKITGLASDEPASFRLWLIVIMDRFITERHRSRREKMYRLEAALLSDGDGDEADAAHGQEAGKTASRAVSEAEAFEQLHKCLSQVRPEDRTLLESAYFEGLSHEELAELLKITKAAVNGRLQRARERMLQCMGSSSAYDVPGR